MIFLEPCPPTPPLSQHFALNKEEELMGVGVSFP